MKVEIWPVDKVIPYERNPRKNEAAVDGVAKSINAFGFRQPIVVDKAGVIVAGHTRWKAAKQLGLDKVPVHVADLSKAEAMAYRLADNKTNEAAEWDNEMLEIELAALKDMDFDIDLTGFSDSEFSKLTGGGTDGNTDPDAVPEPPKKPKTKRGQLFKLGNHRLMCGDATSPADVDRLISGEKVDMVFTDPPYGIAYSSRKFNGNKSGVTNKRNKAEMILGDGGPFDPSFLLQMFSGVNEMFIFGFQYYPEKLGRGGIIVWNKKRESEIDNPHGDFELCWSRRERNKMCWLEWGGFKNKEKGEDRLHTTQKPVALPIWFFNNWGSGLVCVADLFGGSGSTLIACEKTERQCLMMELDPQYCDVIIKRWENFTGKKAELIDGTKPPAAKASKVRKK